jgi:hypothetical protein
VVNSNDINHTVRPGPRFAHLEATDPARLAELKSQLGPGTFVLVSLFVSPSADFATIVAKAQQVFENTLVIACTTAGEIGVQGYTDDSIAAKGRKPIDPDTVPIGAIHDRQTPRVCVSCDRRHVVA